MCLCNCVFLFYGYQLNQKNPTTKKKKEKEKNERRQRACPGVEPGTSRTLSENHATRPTGQCLQYQCDLYINHFVIWKIPRVLLKVPVSAACTSDKTRRVWSKNKPCNCSKKTVDLNLKCSNTLLKTEKGIKWATDGPNKYIDSHHRSCKETLSLSKRLEN